MSETFVRCICRDPMDRELLIPLRRVKEIETNADGDDRVITYDGEVYIPVAYGNTYESIVTLGGTQT